MSAPGTGEITRLLHAHRGGDRGAFDQLVELVQGELRAIARGQMRRVGRAQTLDTLGLVNEAYLRLVGEGQVDWQDRAHFYAVTARAMRYVLVDHARRGSADKRGGGDGAAALDSQIAAEQQPAETVLAVHRAIEQLEAFDERLARLVEYRFFAGMTEEEMAAALGVSLRTVQRDWMRARAWLQRALAGPLDAGDTR
jgi:RNA polymerase sigma factor (TIGR02999 family)